MRASRRVCETQCSHGEHPAAELDPTEKPRRWLCKVRGLWKMKTGLFPRARTWGKWLRLKGSHQKGTSGTTLPNQRGVPLVKPQVAKGEGDSQPHHKKPRNRLCDPPHHPSPIPTSNPASPHMIGAPGEKTTPVCVTIVGSMVIFKGSALRKLRERG